MNAGNFIKNFVASPTVLVYKTGIIVVDYELFTVLDNDNCEFEGFRIIDFYDDNNMFVNDCIRFSGDAMYVSIDKLNEYLVGVIGASVSRYGAISIGVKKA